MGSGTKTWHGIQTQAAHTTLAAQRATQAAECDAAHTASAKGNAECTPGTRDKRTQPREAEDRPGEPKQLHTSPATQRASLGAEGSLHKSPPCRRTHTSTSLASFGGSAGRDKETEA